jgi:hypothetical protein
MRLWALSLCWGEVRGSTLEGDQGTDIHKDEEQYQDHDDHHYKVRPAHI